ncbi:MAG TPA: hypothetical protein VHR72_05085 [Gemmataceae bacterium]|jgi:hypothetical protein|nr:hypothetical protein [Gemmataceae bacterium]
MRPHLSTLTLLLVAAPAAVAQTPAAPSLPEIAAMVKPLLVQMVPPVLYEHTRNWGRTTMAFHGVHWRGLEPEVVKTPRNDGLWQKVRLKPRELDKLDFKLTDPVAIDADRQSFQAYVDFVTGVEYEQQLWERGTRLYSGATRAHVRVQAFVTVESSFKVDASNGLDFVFRLKATKAKVLASRLVVEHTAGIGGSGARLVGQAIEGLIKEVEPGLQRRLQEKIEAALVKAADTREVRIGLGSLFSSKSTPKK